MYRCLEKRYVVGAVAYLAFGSRLSAAFVVGAEGPTGVATGANVLALQSSKDVFVCNHKCRLSSQRIW